MHYLYFYELHNDMTPRIQTEVSEWNIASLSPSILGSPPTTLNVT